MLSDLTRQGPSPWGTRSPVFTVTSYSPASASQLVLLHLNACSPLRSPRRFGFNCTGMEQVEKQFEESTWYQLLSPTKASPSER